MLITICVFSLLAGDRRTSGFRSINPNVHLSILTDAIKSEFQDQETFQAINRAAWHTDLFAVKRHDAALHFDNEAFTQSTQRLAQNLNDAMTLLSECKKGKAIEKIGEALHALQDFYAHSNWVENHLTSPPTEIPICPSLVSLNGNGVFVAGSLAANPNFTDTAWVESTSTCTTAPGAPASVVTGGYYPATPCPPHKCTHDEMNKDWSDNESQGAPSPRGAYVFNGSTLHEFAKNAATRHTKQIWGNDNPLTSQGLKQALTLRFGPAQGVEYYDLLVKPHVKVGFNIDVTGSMGDALAIVKQKVHAWVAQLEEAQNFPDLTLVTFRDSIAFQEDTCSPSEFLDWVDALIADGGGDCPEASLTGALAAAERVGEGGTIILATDASPREDEAIFEQLKAVLIERDITCHTIWKDNCGPVSLSAQGAGAGEGGAAALTVDVYPELAEISGGLSLPFDEMENALDLILESLTESLVGSSIDILCGGWVVELGSPQLIDVPVDDGLASLDFVLVRRTGANTLLEVLRPDGALVQPTDPDATFLTGATLRVIGVTAPTAGIWVMRITGDGSYDAYVRGIGETAIFDVTFLRMEEVEGDSPLISNIDGPLQLWETVDVEIDMIGPLPALSFDLIRPDGSVIEPLEVGPDALGLGVYSGLYTPKQVIDRFYVRARDSAGGPFQRVLRRGFKTYTDLVVNAPQPATTLPGSDIVYTFQIQNLGVPDTFAVIAISENNFPVSVSHSLINLGEGQSTQLAVTVSIPADAAVAQDALTLDIKSTTDATRNVATVLTVIQIPPGDIVWNSDALSPDRTTRSLRFRVEGKPNGSLEDAIKVTMVDLQNVTNAPCCPPQNFGSFESATCTAAGETNGCARWVGKPATFYESQDNDGLGNYRAARLQCSPFYMDWVAETATKPITVVGAEILPSSEYRVQAYGVSCKDSETGCPNVSAAVQMLTRRSADVASAYNPPGTTTQPDALDVNALVNKFKFVPGSPSKALLQLQPNLPELNGDINALDIVAVVDGVKGFAYSFAGPCPCPSLVVCGATPCPGGVGTCTGSGVPGLGAGAMCVKTCSGSGDPCINPGHCPTGETCGTPLCRDKCGRCTP